MSSEGSAPPREVVPEVAAAAADDASALTNPTATAGFEQPSWLKPNPDASSIFILKPRVGKISTKLWNFFHVVAEVKPGVDACDLPSNWNDERGFACCNMCGQLLVAAGELKRGSWSKLTNANMVNHLASNIHSTSLEALVEQHAPPFKKGDEAGDEDDGSKKRKFEQASLSSFGTKSSYVPAKDRRAHQELRTVGFIVKMGLPLTTVEDDSFRAMIEAHNKHAKPMSRHRVKSISIRLEEVCREEDIKQMSNQQVNLTHDHWTARNGLNYSGMTAHWADEDFKIHRKSLGIFLHEGGSTSEELFDKFLKLILNKLKLSTSQLFAVTTDTASPMNKFGFMLEEMKTFHVYCTDHLLHLTCKLCYDLDDTIGPRYAAAVTKARALVSYFNSSTQAAEKLRNTQMELHGKKESETLKVVADVVTRWWATHAMITRLILLKPSINRMKEQNQLGKTVLEEVDWDILADIVKVLAPFKGAQKRLEGDKYVSSSWVAPAIGIVRTRLTDLANQPTHPQNGDPPSKVLAKAMLSDFEDRWGKSTDPMFTGAVQRGYRSRQVGIHPALLVASFLDPRWKSLASVPDAGSKVAIQEHVLGLMKELEASGRGDEAAEEPEESQDLLAPDDDDDDDDAWLAGMEARLAGDVPPEDGPAIDSVEAVCASELQCYIRTHSLALRRMMPDGKMGYNDPLEWWKKNKTVFPNLAQLARTYLPIQATSAPSERIFSQAALIIREKRNRLGPEISGKLLYLKENWDQVLQLNLREAIVEDEIDID